VVFVNDIINGRDDGKLAAYGVKLIACDAPGITTLTCKAALGKIKNTPGAGLFFECHCRQLTSCPDAFLNRKIHRPIFRTRDNNFALQGLLGF